MEVYCIQVKREFPDSGINQDINLVNCPEQNHFILPDIKTQTFNNDPLQLKADTKDDFEVSLAPEDVPGTSCPDQLTSNPRNLKLLDGDSLTFDQKLETVKREMVFENHGTIYPQSLNLQEVNSFLTQVGIKEEVLSAQTATDAEMMILLDHGPNSEDSGLEIVKHHNTINKNSVTKLKGCVDRRNSIQRKPPNLSLPCLHCKPKKIFKSHDALTKHHLCHERVYILNRCFYCSTTFKKFDTLKNHMKIHYLGTSIDHVENTASDGQGSNDVLHLHDHNYCDTEGNSESIRAKSVEMSDILFQSEEDLEFQLSMHSRGRTYMYRCDYCEESFDSKSQIAQHLLKSHSNNKCNHCNRIFPNKSDFIPHILSHWVEKLHKCSECEKVFHRKSALREHMFSHSDEELPICAKCGKAHPWKTNCKPPQTPPPPVTLHKCSYCGQSFTSRGILMAHILTHLVIRHKCSGCRKEFSNEDVLNTHTCYGLSKRYPMVLREQALEENNDSPDEKHYECSLCPKEFQDVHRLNIHILSHCGTEVYNRSILKHNNFPTAKKTD